MNDSMNHMPIRDLIKDIRGQTKQLPPEQMLLALTLNCITNRLEREADLADAAIKFVTLSPGDPDITNEQFEAYHDLKAKMAKERPEMRKLP